MLLTWVGLAQGDERRSCPRLSRQSGATANPKPTRTSSMSYSMDRKAAGRASESTSQANINALSPLGWVETCPPTARWNRRCNRRGLLRRRAVFHQRCVGLCFWCPQAWAALEVGGPVEVPERRRLFGQHPAVRVLPDPPVAGRAARVCGHRVRAVPTAVIGRLKCVMKRFWTVS